MPSMTDIPIVLVVAMARNRVIGADGGMPWTLPTDLARYRRLTMGRPMIMGRRTLDAIGRLLDGRDSIVLSHDAGRVHFGAVYADTLEAALRLARASAGRRGSDAITVVGGEEIFRQFLARLAKQDLYAVFARLDDMDGVERPDDGQAGHDETAERQSAAAAAATRSAAARHGAAQPVLATAQDFLKVG